MPKAGSKLSKRNHTLCECLKSKAEGIIALPLGLVLRCGQTEFDILEEQQQASSPAIFTIVINPTLTLAKPASLTAEE